jgi:hypothetical protein
VGLGFRVSERNGILFCATEFPLLFCKKDTVERATALVRNDWRLCCEAVLVALE